MSLAESVACERLTKYAGLTMNSHHTRMSDKLFEQLVLLKANKPLYSLQWLLHLHQYWLLTQLADHDDVATDAVTC